jgi:hypothetical protein
MLVPRLFALTATTDMLPTLALHTATMGRIGSLVAYSSALDPGSTAGAAGIGAGVVAGAAEVIMAGAATTADEALLGADLKVREAG